MQLIVSEFSTETNSEDEKSRINRLKANLKRLYQEESEEQKTKTKQKETLCTKQSKQTTEVIELATKMLNNLKESSTLTPADMKENFKLITDTLKILELKLSAVESNQPTELLKQIVDELNSVKS
ncbi:unnamed protein product [Didymodactylos carnosus]|uniref:Uncharacterized protein n=1 Tax=Didymodactylos carnosus TaxID=1234261 RepID=A0A8S2V0A5_9BILA|nr:unnamed protein product [Didymodactylos carnosus]